MADELNIPTHRWYQKRNHIALAKEDFSRQYIYDSGIQKIDAWINSQPWGDVYIVNRLSPNLVFDFDATYYRTGGTATDLVSAATHTRAGNATMVDSDGFRKWAPHNLLTYSEDFSNATWGKTNISAVGSLLVPDTSSNFHALTKGILPSSHLYKISFRAEASGYNFVQVAANNTASNYVTFNLSAGTVAVSGGSSSGTIELVDGQYLCTAQINTFPSVFYISVLDSDTGVRLPVFTGDGVSGVYVRNVRVYRSDLGGMVDNPATGDSYVPTTDSARYLPRVGHHIWNGSAWVDEGLLLESEARTNLLTYSSEFDNAAWSASLLLPFGSGSVANAAVAPDGTTSADLIAPTTDSSNSHYIRTTSQPALTTGASGTFSVFVKSAGYTTLTLRLVNTDAPIVNYDMVSISADSASGTITPVGNGWFRCTITGVGTGTTAWPWIYPNQQATYAGDGTSGIYIWGAQFEAAPTPSSYIPTSDATVTRAADAMTIPAANLPWNPLAVSIQMEGTMTYADDGGTEVIWFDWRLNSSNYIQANLRTQSAATGEVYHIQAANGISDDVDGRSSQYFPGINVPFNIASRHGSTFINGAVDGTALTADLTPTALPYLENTDMQIGSTFNGTIKLFRVWADDLTDAGIEEAST